jgi:hypothetical protein
MSRDQNAGQNRNIKIDNKSLERVEQFKCLGTTLTNRNSIQGEIKSRLKSFIIRCRIFCLPVCYPKIQRLRYIEISCCLFFVWVWNLISHKRAEHRLRVFKNRVLRRIFGPGWDEVTGEWRRLHNEELNDLYSSPNIIRVIKSRRMRWAGHVARMGKGRGLYRILVGRPEGRTWKTEA